MSDDTTNRSAVTETRTFTVECRRRIVESCEVWDEVNSTGYGITSITAAETHFRDGGWKLHADGTASCPACLAAWDRGLDLPKDDVPEDGEWVDAADDVDPDGMRPGDVADVDAAHNEAIRREVDGDGGYGETLRDAAAGEVVT